MNKHSIHHNAGWRLFIVLLVLCGASVSPAQAEDIPFFATYPHIDQSRWYLSHGWTNGGHHSCEWRAEALKGEDGHLRMWLSDHQGATLREYGCAEIQTRKMFGYGRYEARMRTAAGSGLNTAFFTFTGPPHGNPVHDEIDFEFLGKEPGKVEVNYHRKGKNMGPFTVTLGFDASADFHDYAFEWMPDKIRWYADGRQIFETPDGADIPDNPGRLYFSLWSGTKKASDWLGRFHYKGPVNADVAWVKFTPMDALEAAEKDTEQ
ncbi:MAG: family 16 glycosylhydrolase [Rhodospirillales bacterium]|nr:family 16 glycosylhydrolase [Rhodospirillales bacterium]